MRLGILVVMLLFSSQAFAGPKDDLVKVVVTIKSKISASVNRAGFTDLLGDLRTASQMAAIQKAVSAQVTTSVFALDEMMSATISVWDRSINIYGLSRGQGGLRQIIYLNDKNTLVKGHAEKCRDNIAALTSTIGYSREETFQILGEEFVASGLVNMALTKVGERVDDAITKLTGSAPPPKKP